MYGCFNRADLLGEPGDYDYSLPCWLNFGPAIVNGSATRMMASFEFGTVGNPSVRIVPWSEIIASGKTPQAIRTAARPMHIPISFVLGGTEHHTEIAADGRPFGIE